MGEQVIFTIEQLIARQEQLKATVEDFHDALVTIRGDHFEDGIETDDRVSVQLLYKEYGRAQLDLDRFKRTTFVRYNEGGMQIG